MGKKKERKKLKSEKKKATLEKLSEKDEKFDFGGLPERDLKKNLGCG